MPAVRYIGPVDAVDVVGVGAFTRGDEADVTDEQAKALLDQHDNFEAVASTKKKG